MSSGRRQPRLKPWQFLAFEMVLDLASVDRRRLDAARAEMRQQGVSVTNLAHVLERDSLAADQVYALHNECHGRQPPAGVARAPIPFHLWVWGSIESSGEALPRRTSLRWTASAMRA